MVLSGCCRPERSGIDVLIAYNDEPVPDEAILLGRLAEAAPKPQHEVVQRRKE